MRKKLFVVLAMSAALLLSVETVIWHKLDDAELAAGRVEKAYAAAENDGEIDVIDMARNKVTKHISLTDQSSTPETSYMPHNVQVAPKGDKVWVTGNAMGVDGHNKMSWLERLFFPRAYAHGDEEEAVGGVDQVIVIDASTDKIIRRIDIGEGLHLAHVVLTPDGRYAIVTAQNEGAIYKINTETYEVEWNLLTPKDSQPHGLRVSPDGSTAYIAMLGTKSLGVLNIENFAIDYIPLAGQAVQAAVTPDGAYVLATIYDKRSVAIYNTRTKVIRYAPLPAEAKGPVQLYATPDSRFAYVADQGYYFGQPQGNMLYKVDIVHAKVVGAIAAGAAPHGVVVSPDGTRVYVTNLMSNDVSVIDTASNREVAKIPVGQAPNGISLRTRKGATP